jgi:lysophospholipase L1-like esterase
MNEDIVLFGDSYTAGREAGTNRDGALRQSLGVPLYNDLAVSGSTAQQWAADFNDRLSAVVSSSAAIAVGSIGGNDLFAAMSDGRITDGEKYAAAASLFYVLMRLRRKRILLMVYPDPFFGSRPDASAAAAGIAEAIKQIVSLARICGVEVSVIDLSPVLSPIHFDGTDIHPNAAGYAVMAEAIIKMVRGGVN